MRSIPSISPIADRMGADYQRQLAQNPARHSRGIFYTPPEVVDYIVEQTLGPLLADKSPAETRLLQILDPACGCGAFLLGAHRWLCRWYAGQSGRLLSRAGKQAIAQRQLAGIDIDPAAVELARQALGQEAGISPQKLAENIRLGDALLEHDEWFRGRFGTVVTNPPYVNIRRLAKTHGADQSAAYRRRYQCARGAFDLYVLFVERSIAALCPGGRLGAIVPNKLATLDYARRCRELLLETGTLDSIADVSRLRIFTDAEVYPYVIAWTKRPPPADHAIRIVRPSAIPVVGRGQTTNILQSQQRADRGWTLAADLPVESRVATVALGDVCTIHSGATGFQAADLATRLVDSESQHSRSDDAKCFDFITSGNIDPFSIRLGKVRFMGRKLRRPLLPADDPILTGKKRQLYAAQKIVLAGMSQRLEAALDARGLALGVQVYALTEWKIDPLYLLALLNSSLLSYLFRLRFEAKRLAGGYFSLSKRQLAQLPIRILDLRDKPQRREHDRLVDVARRRTNPEVQGATAALDEQMDELVLSLYRVAPEELTALSKAA